MTLDRLLISDLSNVIGLDCPKVWHMALAKSTFDMWRSSLIIKSNNLASSSALSSVGRKFRAASQAARQAFQPPA